MLSAVFTVTLVFNTWIKNTAIIYTLITPLMHATATKLLRHMSTCIQIQVDGSQSSPFQGNSEMLKYPFHLEMKTCYLRNFLLNFSFSLTEINVTSWLCFLLLFLLLKKLHWWGTGLVSELLKKPSWPQINSEHWYYLGLEFLEFPGSYLCLSCGLLTGNKIIFLSSPASFFII